MSNSLTQYKSCKFWYWLLSAIGLIALGLTWGLYQWKGSLPFGPLGRFHILLLHLPIGFFVAWCLLEYLERFKFPSIRPATQFLSFATALIATDTTISGFLLASESETSQNLILHQYLGISFCLLTYLLSAIKFWKFKDSPTNTLYGLGLFLCALVMGATGHLGGEMTHGQGYIEEIFFEASQGPIPETEPQPLGLKGYDILNQYCFKCHGEKRAKGKLRLHTREVALKGGRSGQPAIDFENPSNSSILPLLNLPRDHDDAMPPEGKKQLSDSEFVILMRWIYNGAPYPKSSPN